MTSAFLLDTHTWLWWNGAPRKLSPRVHRVIANPDNRILVSVATAWEIVIKSGLGKLELPDTPEAYIPRRLADNGFDLLPIELPHILTLANLPAVHRDPFDRLLVAQARSDGLTILSADPLIAQYPVAVVWA